MKNFAERSRYLLVAACFLFSSVSSGAADPSQVPQLAELYGHTLGAASGCPSVLPERLGETAARAAQHLREVAGSGAAADAAAGQLAAGIERGKRDLSSGILTCAQAESELANLEHDLSP